MLRGEIKASKNDDRNKFLPKSIPLNLGLIVTAINYGSRVAAKIKI